jgi:LysM repeat protein
MRGWLRWAGTIRRPWLLALASLGAVGVVAGAIFAISTGQPGRGPGVAEPDRQAGTNSLAEPPAPVTELEPAGQAAPSPTAELSPFSGIAEPAPQPPRRSRPVHHIVVADEVLWQIAEHYVLRAETLLWANDIDDPDLLLIGQDLVIPPEDGVLYTVRTGDQLADIANRYGVEQDSIISTNNLDNADQIVAGVDIFLPGGRPLSASGVARPADDTSTLAGLNDEQASAATGPPIPLPENIDVLLGSGWLRAQQVADLYKTADRGSSKLHQLPAGARLERLDGFRSGRIQVRDPGDGHTRQAMTGWVNAVDLDVSRAPATRELAQAYPADTAMDIFHVFAPYRTQLDGSPYSEANCGPVATAMALEAFGVSVSSRQLRAAVLDAQHTYGNGVGTLITALAQVVQQNGLAAMDLRDGSGEIRRWGLDDIRAHVQQGHPVIVQVRYRSLPGRGRAYYFGDHYILVTGVVGDGFLYNDPLDADGLGWDRVISGATLRVAMNASDQRYAYAAVAVGR